MADVTERMNYFDRQFLRAADFEVEQAYHLDRRRRQNRLLHTTPAVAGGLEVTGSISDTEVTVGAGTAIDAQGRQIVLAAEDKVSMPSVGAVTTEELYIVYGEEESLASEDPGVDGNTRITEQPTFSFSAASGGVLLAEIALNGSGVLTAEPDNSVRTYADDMVARSLTLRRDGVDPDQWPRLTCSQADQLALEGNLRLEDGREVLFQDNGQIRSFDDYHRIVFNRASDQLELREYGAILFLTGGAPPTEKMRILGNGNVGIGTDDPRARLEVLGRTQVRAVGNDAVYTSNHPQGAGKAFHLIGTYQGWDKEAVYIAGYNFYNPAGAQNNSAAQRVQFGREKVTIDLQNGNVGLGTGMNSTPQNKLQVGDGDIAILGSMIHRAGKIRLWQEVNNSDEYVSHAIGTEHYHNTYGPGGLYANSLGHKFYSGGDGSGNKELIAQIGYGENAKPKNRLDSLFAGNVTIGAPQLKKNLFVNGIVRADRYIRNFPGDFAEYFESSDGKEIPVGTSVIMDGEKVRAAKKDETPIGVISANPAIANGASVEWPEKYLRDEFGCLIMEKHKEQTMVPKTKKVKKERQKVEKKTIEEEVKSQEVVLKDGKYRLVETTEKVKREIEEPVFEEVDLYDASGKKVIGKHLAPVMETYEEEVEVLDENGELILVKSGKSVTKERPKLNPEYDESKQYIPREDRPEWNCVGILGKIPLRKGQPVANSWIKIKDISDDVELWLVK